VIFVGITQIKKNIYNLGLFATVFYPWILLKLSLIRILFA